MAQQVTIILVDDIDGSTAGETVAFGLDRVDYEIDLSAKNAKSLRRVLQPWVDAARRTGGRRRGRTPAAPRRRGAVDRGQSGDIRAWARESGYRVAGRGRLPADVIDAFNAAHAR
jgi:nucleoid-associated protein Lsr2